MKVKNLVLCFFVLFFSPGLFAQSETQNPNILFIAIDDLKPTIGSFGDAFAQTPIMDALSKEATIFFLSILVDTTIKHAVFLHCMKLDQIMPIDLFHKVN